MEKKMLKRDEIDQKYKWNLTDYYENWEAWIGTFRSKRVNEKSS